MERRFQYVTVSSILCLACLGGGYVGVPAVGPDTSRLFVSATEKAAKVEEAAKHVAEEDAEQLAELHHVPLLKQKLMIKAGKIDDEVVEDEHSLSDNAYIDVKPHIAHQHNDMLQAKEAVSTMILLPICQYRTRSFRLPNVYNGKTQKQG